MAVGKIIANFKFDLGCLWCDLHSSNSTFHTMPYTLHIYRQIASCCCCLSVVKTDLNIWIFDVSDKILLWIYGIRLYLQPHIDCTFLYASPHHHHHHHHRHCHHSRAAECSFAQIIPLQSNQSSSLYAQCNRTNPPFIRINRTIPNENFITKRTRCRSLSRMLK